MLPDKEEWAWYVASNHSINEPSLWHWYPTYEKAKEYFDSVVFEYPENTWYLIRVVKSVILKSV